MACPVETNMMRLHGPPHSLSKNKVTIPSCDLQPIAFQQSAKMQGSNPVVTRIRFAFRCLAMSNSSWIVVPKASATCYERHFLKSPSHAIGVSKNRRTYWPLHNMYDVYYICAIMGPQGKLNMINKTERIGAEKLQDHWPSSSVTF